ncbi:MAG: AgmX/PglI C-terminal domain-containing protein [Candidatus Pacearchaeota archaeon]|nr:AgmX/PglI C-terminal domain-containing protein [Candidatus Pacearchaeota archaeon]
MNKLLTVFMVCLLVTILFCGKKQVMAPVLIFNSDTLSMEKVALLEPVEGPDSIRYRNVGIRLICDEKKERSVPDSIVAPFRERVSLITNVEWTNEAAALLLNASEYILSLFTEEATCGRFNTLADSLCIRLRGMIVPEGALIIGCSACNGSESDTTEKEKVLETLLGVSTEVVALVDEFLKEDQGQPATVSGSDAKNMIQGLLSKSGETTGKQSSKPKTQTAGQPVKPPVDNSAATLKYRDHSSIRDSISKHIPNLKQLYRKKLKNTSTLSGKVVVTLRVAPDGHVLSATIKQTQISDQTFLKPFIAYLKTMRFKPIPPKVGAITFDFPFEFNAEM